MPGMLRGRSGHAWSFTSFVVWQMVGLMFQAAQPFLLSPAYLVIMHHRHQKCYTLAVSILAHNAVMQRV